MYYEVIRYVYVCHKCKHKSYPIDCSEHSVPPLPSGWTKYGWLKEGIQLSPKRTIDLCPNCHPPAETYFVKGTNYLRTREENNLSIGTIVDKSQATELSSTSNMPPFELKSEKNEED